MATGREEEVGVEVEGEAAAEVEEEDGIETVPEIDRVIEKKGVYLFFFSLPSFFFFSLCTFHTVRFCSLFFSPTNRRNETR